jgi:hypothetical protein
MAPVFALVGRPNVGKSTLFNALTRTRDAIVADEPGLTRDRQFGIGHVDGKRFIVVDTGGLSGEQQVLDDMHALGGRIFSIGSQDADVTFGAELPELVRNVLYLPTLQLMAFHRAVAKGLDPDNPTNLVQVIHLDIP